MPAATIGAKRKPTIVEPIQVASTSLVGQQTKGRKPFASLQSIPSSSVATCHDAFALGSVYRIASKGTLKRSRALVSYVTRDIGIVVVDVESQATTSSSSFSTSLQPITPPLVLHDATHQLTLAVLQSRTDDLSTDLHAWSEERGGIAASTSANAKSHSTVHVAKDVCALHPLSATELVAQHRDGALSIIAFGQVRKPELSAAQSITVGSSADCLFAGVFDHSAMKYILHDSTQPKPSLALFVSVTGASSSAKKQSSATGRKGRKSAMEVIDAAEGAATDQINAGVKVSFVSIEEAHGRSTEQRIRKVGEAYVKGFESSMPVSVTIHASGLFCLLNANGDVASALLGCKDDGSPFVGDIAVTAFAMSSTNASVLAVSPTTVLVAGIADTNAHAQELTTILLDVDIGAVLDEYRWRAPFAEGCDGLALHRSGGNSALLLGGPKSTAESKAMAHIWHIPYETSEGNHLRWSLVNRQLTKKWLALSNADHAELSSDAERQRLLRGLRDLTRGSASSKRESMEKLFAQWFNEQSSLSDRMEVDEGEERELKAARSVIFPKAFMADLLSIIFAESDSNNDEHYPKAIVDTLVREGAIRNEVMPSKQILKSLSDRKDWSNVRLALAQVKDLHEDDVVHLVRRVSEAEGSDVPQVNEILVHLANLHLSSVELRRAMKETLESAQVAQILDCVQAWLTPDQSQPLLRSIEQKAVTSHSRPSLQAALTFATDFMDTFFPLLLATPSLHQPLQQLSAALKEQIVSLASLGVLRGPLAAFAKVEEDREREAEALLVDTLAMLDGTFDDDEDDDEDEQGLGREVDANSEDDDDRQARFLWSKGGRQALGGKAGRPRSGANATMQIGGGVDARSGQREKSRRQQSFADRMAVGLYALERFEP